MHHHHLKYCFRDIQPSAHHFPHQLLPSQLFLFLGEFDIQGYQYILPEFPLTTHQYTHELADRLEYKLDKRTFQRCLN